MGQVAIYNRALNLLGQTPISSINEDKKSARALNIVWDMLVKELLLEEPWSFSLKQTGLAQISNGSSNITGYAYEYQYPADCIKIVQMYCSDGTPLQPNKTRRTYKILGDKIYSDEDCLAAEYIHLPSNIDNWFIGFQKCLAYKLAIETCYNLINSSSREAALETTYQKTVLPKALGQDSQQETVEEVQNILIISGDINSNRGY